MMVGSAVSIHDGKLSVLGMTTILSDVDEKVVLTPNISGNGAVLGVVSAACGGGCSHCVFPIGKLQGLRFMCLFRFKLWWMTQRMGSSASEIPFETQFLLVEAPASGNKPASYTVFLPLIDGSFRSVLQGNAENVIEICVQSGDPAVDGFQGNNLVFVGTGTDPFDVVTDSVRSVEKHLQTFSHRETKQLPDMMNWFGWCTWDAFYTDVSADGIRKGLRSFKEGGVVPRFLIIDDGWQTVEQDPVSQEFKAYNTANFANRLTDIKENHKFRQDEKDGNHKGLTDIVAEIKQENLVKYVYVWHSITGYWGGVRPGAMTRYRSEITFPVSSPGVQPNQSCEAFGNIVSNGLGLVHPDDIFNFYDDLHSYLASAGVDGVKVDVQSILETLGGGHGGRVKLSGKYHRALEASVACNFPGNGIISCMSHNTDSLYHAKSNAVIRASDDFFPNDPASHTIHVASVAYNTVFLGEFMQPDWDMFHSLHPMAEYHGAARAIGGCPIYVSDKPGCHDFNLLKKLVLPDGSILRANLPGRPTVDCLFSDPLRDNRSILKIWNANDCTGVVGAFNCQGAGWCKVEKMNLIHDDNPSEITGTIQPKDIPYLSRIAGNGWNGDSVIYSHRAGALKYLHHGEMIDITLKSKEYEIFTVVPVKEKLISGGGGISFCAIGLVDMFNSGGAVKEINSEEELEVGDGVVFTVKLRGSGRFGAYASVEPKRIQLDSEDVGFDYDEKSGLVVLTVGEAREELYITKMNFQF